MLVVLVSKGIEVQRFQKKEFRKISFIACGIAEKFIEAVEVQRVVAQARQQ